MKLNFENPPLIEALCEINFIPEKAWDLTYPADFYNAIKSNFPKKITKTNQGIGFSINNRGINIGTNNRTQILQCYDENNHKLIQIGENLLVINSLPPYMKWESFKELIISKINLYKKLFSPKSISKITLKYTNKINIGEVCNYDNLKSYLNFRPEIPNIQNNNANSVSMNIEIPQGDNENILSLVLATLIKEKKLPAPVLFDLNYVKINKYLEFSDIEKWLEEAHKTIKSFFIKSITEKAIKSFN